jgi:two-component system OmpR family sensor kinase
VGDRRRFRWQALVPSTLTTRLLVGVVSLLVLLILILSGSTYFALRSFLYGRLDQQVDTVANRNAELLQRGLTNSNPNIFLFNGGDKLWLSLISSNGTSPLLTVPSNQRNNFAVLDLSTEQKEQFIAHPNQAVSLNSGGEPVRVESVALSDGNYMVIGLSTREVQKTLNRLLLLELVIGTSVVAVAAGLTSWGVRADLRPLHRVTRTAQEVTAELGPDGSGLSRRVPVEGAAVEVEQVARSVNTLLYAVETEFAARVRSEERMRQFLADASHELRTPLTSIRGYAELSRLRASADAADDSMRRIETEGTRMSRLVEDLLVLARGDQDSARQVSEIDVDELMSEAADAVRAAHPERDIEVAPETGLTVTGDWDQLLRVLINLTTNAAIHTPSGPIRLQAGAAPGGVALQVIDTGPGLPPDEVGHVFERFWRADKARSRAKGGSGLGMAIVAQIVQAHGGMVHFDSDVARGTTVTVTLPAAAGFPPPDPNARIVAAPTRAVAAPPPAAPVPPGTAAPMPPAPPAYPPQPATRQN